MPVRLNLRPLTGTKIVNGEMIAESLPAWFRLETSNGIRSGRWVRLRYRESIFSNNVRPLIRFTTDNGATTIHPMNGTLFGVGEWIGFIPKDVSAIAISPVARAGPFSFYVEQLEYISAAHFIRRGLTTNLLALAWSAQAWWLGAHAAARRGLKVAGSSTNLNRYADWQGALSRTIDMGGIDRPCADWNGAPVCRLFIVADGQANAALRTTVQSLVAQLYPRWTLTCLIDANCCARQRREIHVVLGNDPRISIALDDVDWCATVAFDGGDLCAVVVPGDRLPNYALAVLVEVTAREPSSRVIYGDEDSISSAGELHTPILRPDWSRQFQTATRYIGNNVWLRARDLLRHVGPNVRNYIAQRDDIVDAILADCGNADVHHVRRILCRRSREPKRQPDRRQPAVATQLSPTGMAIEQWPAVTAIVPSRDNARCLATCIDGLLNQTDYPNLRITLVDNGSIRSDALALLRNLATCAKVNILKRPGPFNYSALCNNAAATSDSPLLVFLNDDVAMTKANWLKPLVAWATRPEVGVAGAKLLFPNGRIQHAGVVIGMGGIAAHLYHNKDAEQAGYLNQLTVAHEVSAVTAACIAIERKKFETVGGFDEINLPVELNDIDLCLRLGERGLSTIWTPESVLTHREAASRGASWSGDAYKAERAYFIERWQNAIRDDRYFHPDLSLFSYAPALA